MDQAGYKTGNSDKERTMEQYLIDSRDMKTKLAAYEWVPKNGIQAIVIAVHGMSEYMLRYAEMAEYLNTKGILFAGIDLLGHGKSVSDESELGYFCERDAATVVVRDVHRLKKTVQDKYPGIPVFLFGHSMGSFIARNYIERYGTGIDGVIIQGGGDNSGFKLGVGKALTSAVGKLKGPHYRSKLCTAATLGAYINSVKNEDSTSAWIAKRKEVVKKYDEDPLCGFIFTVNGYDTLVELCSRSRDRKLLGSIPKSLPMLIVSGREDPVGENGAGVQRMYDMYKELGMEDIKMELIDDARHEIHNEDKRYELFDKYAVFIENHSNKEMQAG